MLKHLVVGSVILFGSSLLAGCGVNGNLTATPTGNGTHNGMSHAPHHIVATSTHPLTNSRAINQAVTLYLKARHIQHPRLPVLPLKPSSNYGITVTQGSPQYPNSFGVSVVGVTRPLPLNAARANPNHVSLAALVGYYGMAPLNETVSSLTAFKDASQSGLNSTFPLPWPSHLANDPVLVGQPHQTMALSSGIRGTLYLPRSHGMPAMLWKQGHWTFEMTQMVNPRTNGPILANRLIQWVKDQGVLKGRGVCYVVAAGDGLHTVMAWQSGPEVFLIENYQSTRQALEWLSTFPESPLVK